MKVMQQDENYEEEELELDDGEEYEYDDECSEDTSASIETLWGIPKKYVIVGAAAILVICIFFFVISTIKRPAEEEAYIPPVEEEVTQESFEEVTQEPMTEQYTEEEQTVQFEDGEVGPNGLVWDATIGAWSDQESWDSTHNVTVESASTEDELLLRKMGYTGDEIQFCLDNGFSVEDMVEAAQKLRDEEAKEALKRMSNEASDEFRYIVDNTYFGQPEFTFEPQTDKPIEEATFYDGQFTVNADYVKCPSYGAQLQLKCKVSNNCYVWYVVTPRRWESLPEQGNIVLTVDYTVWGSYAYITSIKEVDPSLATVDASVESSISENISNTTQENTEEIIEE